jgi:2-keto-4-pentenoate hydratase/2-oxohepta-3-ene-1,7-dioic acid hydratase in catechol pathway
MSIGTPEGVGPVVAGDVIQAGITGVVTCQWNVAARAPAPAASVASKL